MVRPARLSPPLLFPSGNFDAVVRYQSRIEGRGGATSDGQVRVAVGSNQAGGGEAVEVGRGNRGMQLKVTCMIWCMLPVKGKSR